MVDEGFAVTLVPVVALRPVEGLHVYPPLPLLAFKVTEPPLQMVEEPVGVMLTVPPGFTVTTCVAVEEPQALDVVTVYVCEVPGLAVTVAPVVALNPVAGDHV
jgi:hypothetical protein